MNFFLKDAMSRNHEIIQKFDNYYKDAYTAWNAFYPLAERDLRFYLGDQWDEQEKRDLYQEGRSTFVFNRIRRNINMVLGQQIKNRQSSVAIPLENSSAKTADQLSKLLLYVLKNNGYETISECFGGSVKTGWNLMNLWVDYRDDPLDGDIRFSREPYNSFIVDPYFTKTDFSDCNYIIKRKFLSRQQVQSLLPGQDKDIANLYKFGWERDDKFTWLPYQRLATGEDLMAYNEIFEKKFRSVKTLVDMESGELLEFDMAKEQIDMFLEQYPQLKVIDRQKQYIEKTIIVNDEVMRVEEDPYGLNEYPFESFMAIFEPESDQWGLKVQSLIRCMIDPQREANRRRSQMSDLLNSQSNSGWIANENSVINPRSLFQTSQGKVIWRREDAGPGAIEKIQPAQIPPSMFQLQELFDRDIVEIGGMNDAAFGQMESANESGVMNMLRQGAAIGNLQSMFENLRNSQKNISYKILKIIQTWSPNKVAKILKEEPTEEFYNKEFTKYDIAVQEGVLTDTQRQLYFKQLVDIKNLGAPVTGEMLAEAAPIQGKSEYNKQLAKMEQQQAQQAQKQQEIQDQVQDSLRQQAQAKAISDIALSKERFTRAVANLGLEDERASEAIQNRSQAALDKVKAMKELESMDDDHLLKHLSIIQMMEENNRKAEDKSKSENIQVSAVGDKIGQEQSNISPGNPGENQQMNPNMGVNNGQI